MPKTGFVHLHVHTEYSPLDGIGKLDDLCMTAAADGAPAIANTDHGTLGGIWKAAQAARNAGIKFIPGLEAYFAIGSRFEHNSMSIPRDDDADTGDDEDGGGGRMKTKTYEHLTLLATSAVGWQNLAKMNSAASDSFWSKPRMDFELLAEHSEGIIALTGCIGGPIAGPLSRGDVDTARTNLARLVAAMGHTADNQRVFAEVMDHGIPAEHGANNLIVDLAAEFGVELVATNDAHYVHASDAPSHDLWLAMGTVAQRDSGRFTEELWIDEPNRFHFHGEGYHLRSEAEMRALFDTRPGFERACDNTVVIAEMVEENILPDALLRLPTYDVPPEYADAMSYLIHLVKEGAAIRWGAGPLREDRRDRLRRELATIRKLKFPDYFLMVWDVLNAARAHGIYTGGGRGSAAGSAVSYCLRIVEVDPLEHDLLFERFLDESRTDPPDIDLDFDSEGQDWVFAYLAKRWGHEYVARLGSLGFSRARGSVKTAASVLLDSENRGVGAKLAKRIPIGSTIAQMLDETDQTGESFRTLMNSSADYITVVERALEVEGMAANVGIHACGVIVSTERLAGMVPMRRERKKDWVGGWVIEWDKKDISEGHGKTGLQPLGLLKLDVLGLRNLDVVKRCVKQIEQTTGEIIDPYAIDYDPTLPRVRALWDMLGQGRTAGIFQLESTGITELTEKVRPESLGELSAILALYRPGPMGMKMHEIYAARKRGYAPVDYGIFTNDPEEEKILASVLGDTFGTCLVGGTKVYSIDRGHLVRLDTVQVGEHVQAVAYDLSPTAGKITHFVDNGLQPVKMLTFSSGAQIVATGNHKFLTAAGWKTVDDLTSNDVVATPLEYLQPNSNNRATIASARTRMLGYLLTDGCLSTAASIQFCNSNDDILDAYEECVANAFPGTRFSRYLKGNGVTVCQLGSGRGNGGPAGEAVIWLRSLGLKYPKGSGKRGGPKSAQKWVPKEWLCADQDTVLELVGALWDCDGHVGPVSATFKTISPQLAEDVQFLLLRLGLTSHVTRSSYINERGPEVAFQVTVPDVSKFAKLIAEHLRCGYKTVAAFSALSVHRGHRESPMPREVLRDALARTGFSQHEFCRQNPSVSRTSFRPQNQFATEHTVRLMAEATGDPELKRLLRVRWVQLRSVVEAGVQRVFDITVDDVHNFVANGLVVHNCVYQEQIMQIGAAVAGFGGPMTNKLRSAVSKKDKDKITAVGEQFIAEAQVEIIEESGALAKMAFSKKTAENLWEAIKESGRYSFNKCLTGDTVLQTGSNYTWTIAELYRKLNTIDTPGPDCGECGKRPRKVRGLCEGCYAWHRKFHAAKQGLTLLAYDFEDGRIHPKRVTDVHYNGRKPVFKITLADGRSVEATANHRFLTADGWRHVEDLAVGESLLTDGGYEPHRYTSREYRTTTGDRSGTGRLYAFGEANIGYIDGGFAALKTWTKETTESAECERPGEHQGRMERAHLDGRRTNNHPSNLEWMCVSHHKSHDYRHNGRPRRWEKGHVAIESVIVSIAATGIQDTYDVEMDDDGHNFTANGIISHNSHSVAYGWVSRLTAYCKANWPAQYGAAILAVTKDADRRLPVLADLRAEGLTILPPSVNESFAASTGSAGSVRIGLTEIDGSGIELATAIVSEREANGRFASAADLMTRVRVPQGLGKPALQIASNQVGPLIESGALDEFGPRLGLMMVARALAAQPDTPIIDAEWSILERSARERKRLKGIVLSQHPLAALRDELVGYRAPNAQKPIGVRAIPEEDGTDVLALGVLASWSRSPGKFGERANFVLEGSGAQVPCVMWDKALKSLDGEPMVGSVVALRGRTKARIIEPPVSYEDTDDDDVDESAAVAEMAEPTVRTELTVYGLHLVPVASEPRVQLSTPPIPPILWPVPALVPDAAALVPTAPAPAPAAAAPAAPVLPAKVRAVAASSVPAKPAVGQAPLESVTAAIDPIAPPVAATSVATTEAGPASPVAGPGAHLDILLIQRGARAGRLKLGELMTKYSALTGDKLTAILAADAGSRTGLLPAEAGHDRLVVAVLEQVTGKLAHLALPLEVAGDDTAVTAHIYDMAKKNASPDLPFHPVKGQMPLFEVPGVAACPYGQDPLPRNKQTPEPAVAAAESAAA